MILKSAPENFPSAWRTIPSGQSATYIAHKSVILLPGFTAQAGSNFIARIDSCNGCEGAKHSTLLFNPSQTPQESVHINHNEILYASEYPQEKNYKKELKLYPNPNTGIFQLETNFPLSDIAHLKITNPLGITVYKDQNVTEHTLQLQNSASGLFFVILTLKDGSVLTQKMVVQR